MKPRQSPPRHPHAEAAHTRPTCLRHRPPHRRWHVPNRTALVGRAYAFGVLVADVWPPAPARRTRRPSTGPAQVSGPGRARFRTASAAPTARTALADRGQRQDHHDHRGRLFVHLPGGRRLATAPVRLVEPAAGNGSRGTEKPFQSRGPQAERLRELLDGAALWSAHPAPLDVADRPHTDLGTPGEFLMRESHFTTKRPQHAPECRIPLLCLRHVTPRILARGSAPTPIGSVAAPHAQVSRDTRQWLIPEQRNVTAIQFEAVRGRQAEARTVSSVGRITWRRGRPGSAISSSSS